MPGLTISQPAHRDIFPTPSNEEFHGRRIYEALDPSRQEIRLIRLHLDNNNGPVQCDLLPAVSLSLAKGRYTAISYCAGDPTNTTPILVNGVTFNVFANLAHALDITRDFWTKSFSESECLLWADQICINQCNLTERSHQVGFMRSIYSSAAHTLVCLSTSHRSPETDTLGIEWLNQLHESVVPGDDYYMYYFELERHLRMQLASPTPPASPSSRNTATSSLNTTITPTDTPPRRRSSFTDGWRAFYATIFASPWWLRAWVYQEFVSSANLYFLYGRSSVAWSRVSEVLPTLRKYHGNFGYWDQGEVEVIGDRGVEDAVNFFVVSKMRSDRAGPYELMDLLAQTRHLRRADARDGVYAFLGLVREDYGIVPDYSAGNGMERLLLDMAGRIVRRDGRLDILSYACLARGELSRRLPSWVPDWSCGRCGKVRERTIRETHEKLAAALIPRVREGGELEVQGYKIGTFENGQRLVVHLDGVAVWIGSGQEDDEVWALIGARNPFVLRRVGGVYRVVKEAGFKWQIDLPKMAWRCGLQSRALLII